MRSCKIETSYFKIGLFVLVGLALIIFALLIFGSEKIFKPIVSVETYFEESIQGVSKGSPVKYRGLQIGYVEDIAFTSEIYENGEMDSSKTMYARSLYVKIAITSSLFTRLDEAKLEKFISEEVGEGLRVRLVSQGLTGVSYLEFDYVNSDAHPIPKLAWVPKDYYIPSVTSTLTRLSESAQYIMSELREIDFQKIFIDLDDSLLSFNKLVGKTSGVVTGFSGFINKVSDFLSEVDAPSEKAIQNLKTVLENLRVITDRVKRRPSELIFSNYPPPLDPKKL